LYIYRSDKIDNMKYLLTASLFLMIAQGVSAQTTDTAALARNRAYAGAEASKKHYRAIYQLDNNDPKIIEKAIRNINNALNDPRLKDKVEIEVVTFAGGTDAVLKGSKYEDALRDLVLKGVIVAQCNNSMRERKLSRDQIYDFVAVVPSGNGELIIRQGEGWGIVKP